MKTPLYFLALTFLLTFWSCHKTTRKKQVLTDTGRSQAPMSEKPLLRQANRAQIDEENRSDSLRLNNLLKQALKTAEQNTNSNHFSMSYETTLDTSSLNVEVDLTMGYLFSTRHRHLLIRIRAPWGTYLNLYLLSDHRFMPVLFRESGPLTSLEDTIKDVNGDGRKDFVVHWYPPSGCCKRDMYAVYLNQDDKASFTAEYEFINPTFSPKEGLIRGVLYGHPGEAGLYKYHWNGLKVDTVEFIYPDQTTSNQRQYIRTTTYLHKAHKSNQVSLKSVPVEYLEIEGYDWFEMY